MERPNILKQLVISRSQKRKLYELTARLREELKPEGQFEEFLFTKLIVDLSRLSKLYEYEQREILQIRDLPSDLNSGVTDRFIRYKKSVEKDIDDAYSRLKKH